ncbi:SEC-C metal-binding domain-containing protein [Fodinibius sp. N2]|uniref:SEC-C metal-binding domain-containing protein n=1 Tax=Fodinibius alkaliphilus TaxID=3140241 RepID=UPI0038B3BE19
MADKPRRNDPCHCGSGQKYKNCCIEKDNTSIISGLGVVGLVLMVVLGLWFLSSALSSGGESPDCPAGQTWSESHQHCH